MDSCLPTAQYLDDILTVLKKHNAIGITTPQFTITLPGPRPEMAPPIARENFEEIYKQRVQSMYGG